MVIIERRAIHKGESPSIETAGPLEVDLDIFMANQVSCAGLYRASAGMLQIINGVREGTVTENGEALPLDGLNRKITDLGIQHILAVDRARLKHDSFCENVGLFQGIGDAMRTLSDVVMASAPGWTGV